MFEVEIHGPNDKDAVMRLFVESDTWVEAWREVLLVGIEEQVPADAVCVMHEDDAVHVEVPSTGRTFIIRGVDAKRLTMSPRPVPGQPVLVAQLAKGGGTSTVRVVRDPPTTSRRQRVRQITAPFEAITPGAVVTNSPARKPHTRHKTDPVARVLSQLQRARLMARPVRISSETGLVAPITDVVLASAQSARPKPDMRSDDPDRTAAYVMVGAAEPLPQQFRAVTDPGASAEARGTTLSRALSVCWDQIPCASTQVLKRGRGGLEVLAARGFRERDLLGCYIDDDVALSQLRAGRGAARVLFSEGHRLPYRASDGDVYELAVRSLLTVPLAADGEVWGLVVLINANRESGFADGELRAVSYLAKTMGSAVE